MTERTPPTDLGSPPEDEPGIFHCHGCDATVYSFTPDNGPPFQWSWDVEVNGWFCGYCTKEKP